jgi:hypothetical protein
MPDKEKVEQFRLTPEMQKWARQFKRIDDVSRIIEQGLRIQLGELEESRRMFDAAQGEKMKMLRGAPADQTRELPGQEY